MHSGLQAYASMYHKNIHTRKMQLNLKLKRNASLEVSIFVETTREVLVYYITKTDVLSVHLL